MFFRENKVYNYMIYQLLCVSLSFLWMPALASLASGPEIGVCRVVDPVDAVCRASAATPEGLLAVSLAVRITHEVWQLAKTAVATPTTEALVRILK